MFSVGASVGGRGADLPLCMKTRSEVSMIETRTRVTLRSSSLTLRSSCLSTAMRTDRPSEAAGRLTAACELIWKSITMRKDTGAKGPGDVATEIRKRGY